LKVLTIHTAYKLYIDGVLYTSVGKLATKKDEGISDYIPQSIQFKPIDKKVDLVIQVSNYNYQVGGIVEKIELGIVKAIENKSTSALITTFFIAGALLIMGLYHFSLFLIRRNDYSLIYFSLFCVGTVIRLLNTNEYLMRLIFPKIAWNWLIRLEYIGFYPTVVFFSFYVNQIFPKGNPIFILSFQWLTLFLFFIITLFSDVYIVSQLALPLQACSMVLFFQVLYLIFFAVIEKKVGVWILILGFTILMFTFFNDVLHTNQMIHSYHITPFGVFVFVFSQSYLISIRIDEVYKNNIILTTQLRTVNQNLETLVDNRTLDLKEANEEMQQKQEELLQLLQNVQDLNKRIQKNQRKIKRLSLVASKTQTPIIITNPQGKILWFNHALELSTGFSKQELKSKDFFILIRGAFTNHQILEKIYDAFEYQKAIQEEIICYKKNGEYYWTNLSLTPIFGKDEQLKNFFIVQTDLTLQKQKESLLEKYNKQFKEANQTLHYQNIQLEEAKQILDQKNEQISTQRKELLLEYQRKEDSILYAQRIQSALLTDIQTIRPLIKDQFILNLPKDIVSGDFYWFAHKHTPSEDKIIIAVADCTGHGVPGAFMSMIGMNLFNQIIHDQEIHEPDRILELINEGVKTTLHQAQNNNRDGMDIAVVMIDRLNKELNFAGARRPLIYFKSQELFEIKGDAIDIGGFREQNKRDNFKRHNLTIEKDFTFYLFSDGMQDQFGGQKNKKYMLNQFKQLLKDIQELDMEAQKNIIQQNLDLWKVNREQTDDILIVGIRI
jgi:PAS domain S-box-containing protein